MPLSNKNKPLTDMSLVKSNLFLSSKYRSSLMENQLLSLALVKIESENDSSLQARLYPGDLKKLISDPDHIYRDLKRLSKSIVGHTMFLEDGEGNFKAFSIVPNATYQNGVFYIQFNNELREHVLGLTGGYSRLSLSVMCSFNRNVSFRIYEVLKKDIYKSKPYINSGRVDVEYNLSELRFMIGIANGDDPGVKNEMSYMNDNVDWDRLYNKLDKKDRKYEKWADLSKYVLKPAQEELQEKSDIRFEYEGIREGRSMKRVRFHIYKNTPSQEVVELEQELAKDEIYRQGNIPRDLEQYKPLYDEFDGHNDLIKEDIDILLREAGYDTELVRQAIYMADEQDEIHNYMGWIISCIKNGYKKTKTLAGSAEKARKMDIIIDEMRNEEETGAIQNKVWARTKRKENFADFVDMLRANDLSLEMLESIYTPDERIQIYIDWNAGREIRF